MIRFVAIFALLNEKNYIFLLLIYIVLYFYFNKK